MVMDWVERAQLRLLKRFGAKARYFDGSLGRIHVVDLPGSGTGPPLVIIHGLGDAGVHFCLLLLRLRKDFSRIIVPDLLGHGFSDEHPELTGELIFGALAEVLDHELAGQKAVLFGNSLGGGLAMIFGSMRPDLVERMVLVSPAGADWTEEEHAGVLDTFNIQERRRAVAFVQRLHSSWTWYAHFIAPSLAATYRRPGMVNLVRTFRRESALTPEMLRLIRIPTLLLWGKRDRILPRSALDYFRAHLPATIEEPETWGHCPQLDRVGSLTRRVRRFAHEGV